MRAYRWAQLSYTTAYLSPQMYWKNVLTHTAEKLWVVAYCNALHIIFNSIPLSAVPSFAEQFSEGDKACMTCIDS